MKLKLRFLLVFLLAAGCTFILKESEIASRLSQVERKGVVTLDEPLFDFKVAQTGLWRPCRFQQAMGFGIFRTTEHVPGRLPVLFMHGHADGPGGLKKAASILDPEKFEPMFAFYPTGQELALTVKSMHAALGSLAGKGEIDEIAIVAFSMSGLIARLYLGEKFGRNEAPKVSLLVTISTPWLGSERGGRWSWSPAAPASWKDMTPDSDFLQHLFDNPLPPGCGFHMLYSTAGGTWTIPGPDDGVISLKSATRKEAVQEADSVTAFPCCGHRQMVTSKEPLEKLNAILEDHVKKMAR
jgi:hypothetical protein